jgi:hypothetical protein
MQGSLILTTSTDPFARGLDYLYGVRSLALDPDLVAVVQDYPRREPICTWIGQHIEAVNRQLNAYLQVCHDCFAPATQPCLQIFAAPLAQSFGIDGLCNLQTRPITLLVDVGRVVPHHWLRLVAHEYAHGYVGSPGHHSEFAQALEQLCRRLAIALPPQGFDREDCLRSYPPCQPTLDPLSFWQGIGWVEGR